MQMRHIGRPCLYLILGIPCLGFGVATCLGQASSIGASSPPAAKPAAKATTTENLIAAQAAAERGDHDEAHRLYDLVLRSEARNEAALRAKAKLHLKDGEWPRAAEMLERVIAVRRNDRTATINLAAAYMKSAPPNPMRAAKLVRDYLTAVPNPPDEQMANILGAALAAADDDARQGGFYEQLRTFYFNYDRRLEQARRDGKKRWGSEWLPAGQAAEKWTQLKQKTDAVNAAYRSASETSVEVRKSKEAYELLKMSFELAPQERLRRARQRVVNAERQHTAAVRRLAQARDALAKAEAPPMIRSVEVIAME